MMTENQQKETFYTKDGQPFEIPANGCLGILAIGARGIIAWRQKRAESEAQKIPQDNQEMEKTDGTPAS